MSPKEEANYLVDSYRRILMDEDTECGNEILCTIIAIRCALIAVDKLIDCFNVPFTSSIFIWNKNYYEEVKQEIIKLKSE